MLTVETFNVSARPVDVVGISVGYMYVNALSEAVVGRRAPRSVLYRFAGGPALPATLDVGESAIWTAGLGQIADPVREGRFAPGSHSPYLDVSRFEADYERGIRPGRATLAFRRVISTWTSRRVAVVVADGRGTTYKAKVRWRPPGGLPPRSSRRVV